MADEGVWPFDEWLWTHSPEKHGCAVAQNGLDYKEEVAEVEAILSARFTPEPEPEPEPEDVPELPDDEDMPAPVLTGRFAAEVE